MKEILKRMGIAAGVLLTLLLTVAVINAVFPTYTVSVTRDIAVSPDEAFAAFVDFSEWDNYFEYDELFPPD